MLEGMERTSGNTSYGKELGPIGSGIGTPTD